MNLESPPDRPETRDTLDRPLRDLRISVTDRCNFRCTYCMPAEMFGERYEFLPRAELLTFEEIERLVRIFVDLGVAKVRITGGEPLLRQDLPGLIRALSQVPKIDDLALTTNATLLPKLAAPLAAAGLRRVTVSLDAIDEGIFATMNGGRLSVDRVLEGIDAAVAAGMGPVKINCVVQKGVNDHHLVDLARHFKGTGHILRFIEFMDVGTRNGWDLEHVVTAAEIVERIGDAFPIVSADPNYLGEVARRWRYEDGSGEIGIISSVTEPFCSACTRMRLTTDGKLVTCLFGSEGLDLRGPLRGGASDDEIRTQIAGVWRGRSDRYSDERGELLRAEGTAQAARRVEMYQIGG